MPTRTWQFRVDGADDVIRANDRIRQSEERLGRSRARGGSGGGSYPAQGGDRMRGSQQRDGVRNEERMQRIRDSIRDASLRKEQQMLERSDREKTRAAERGMKERARLEARYTREAERESDRRSQRLKRAASGIGWGVAGGIASAGAMAGGAGLALAGAALRDRMAARDSAVSLAIAGRGAGEALASPDALLKNATKAAISVKGTKTGNLLAGMSRYQAMTGDAAGAEANARTIAIGARASGAQETDIAATLATMKEQFKIGDPEQQREALAQILYTGKSGAFELGNAAQFYTEMGASGSRFGLTGMQGLGQLNAMSQVAMSQTGNGAKASTGVQAMLRQFVAKSDDIKSLTGTNVFTDKSKTKANNVEDVIAGVIGGAGGNLGKIQKLMGDEGMQGISGFVKAYNDAQGALKKGATETEKRAAGEAAVRGLMQQYANSTATASDMIADAAAAGDTASATLTTAWEKISSGVGDALLPAFSKVAEHADSLAEPLTAMGEGVAIVVDRMVGVAKKLGMLKGSEGTEDPSNPKQGPKRALYEANNDLAALTAKEAKLGGLSKEDRAKKMKLQSTMMDLKDELFKADPTLMDKPFDMLSDAGYSKGQGPMRIPDAKSPIERILSGEDLEERRLPTSEAGSSFAKDYTESGTLGRMGLVGGGMFSRALDGKNPFDFSDEGSSMTAHAKSAVANAQKQVAPLSVGGAASNIDQLISVLNANTAATNANTAASKGGAYSTAVK